MIILAVIFALPATLVLYLLGNMALRPTLNRFDQDKFSKLDSDMQNLFSDIKRVSNDGDNWRYDTTCDLNNIELSSNNYNCSASISLRKSVTSTNDLNNLHNKYHLIIDKSDLFKQETKLNMIYDSSSAVERIDKNYIDNKTKLRCKYEVYSNHSDFSNILRFKCSGNARGSWFIGTE